MLDFLERTGALHVVLVSIEQEGYFGRYGFAVQNKVQLTASHAQPHSVTAVDHEDNTLDTIAVGAADGVGLP